MASEEEKRRFGRVKAGYEKPGEKPKKPTHGSLYIDNIIHIENQPFALLQYKKQQLIKDGYLPNRISIRYK